MLATIVIVLLVLLDQLVKYLVKTNIPLGSSVPFLPGILSLAHIHNTGAAFSMILTVAFVIFGMWVLLTGRLRHSLGKWSWVLVLAGAVGNLIDRCLYGYVVDMFEVQFMHFAIFNVADIFVVVGGILFCIYYLFLHDKKKEDAPHDPSV